MDLGGNQRREVLEPNLSAEKQSGPKRPKVRGFTIFLLVLLVVATVFMMNFKTVIVRGNSMVPTLANGRKVLATKAYWLVGPIKVNDIIVLKEEKSEAYFIKRVVGLPGDPIKWTLAPQNHPLTSGPYVVPEGGIYVVGDNLNHSDDSRKFGPFKQERILGKVVTWR